jgi:hypothetical protein
MAVYSTLRVPTSLLPLYQKHTSYMTSACNSPCTLVDLEFLSVLSGARHFVKGLVGVSVLVVDLVGLVALLVGDLRELHIDLDCLLVAE